MVLTKYSKKDTKSVVGPNGIRSMLLALAGAGYASIPTVCIGGINTENTAAVLAKSSAAPHKTLDGVAVVSAIVAAADPAAAARDLLGKVTVAKIADVIGAVAKTTPLSHNMTNLVSH